MEFLDFLMGEPLTGAAAAEKGTKQALEAQLTGQREATQALMDMYQQTREDQAPWREAGAWALGAPAGGFGGQQQDPGIPETKDIEYDTQARQKFRQVIDTRTGMPSAGDPGDDDTPWLGYRENYGGKIPAGWEADPSNAGMLRRPKNIPEGWEQDPNNPGKMRPTYESLQQGNVTTGITGGSSPAGGGIIEMLETGPGEFEADPGYQFRLQEGLRGIENIESARGRSGSMSTSKRLMDYGQQSASQEYDNFMSRYYAKMGPYFQLAGLGQGSAQTTSAAGQQTGQGIAGLSLYGGQAQAAAYQNINNINQQKRNQLMDYGMTAAKIYYGAG